MTDPAPRDRRARVRLYSPIFDELAPEIGTMAAAVYGVLWRHCQLRDGVCRASTRRMARLLGCNRMTVQRQLAWLVSAGYLEDMTPGQRNRPHVYRVTGQHAAGELSHEAWEE